jgi:serine/threonine protein kinase/tetratricopeptide (TPR) repeat protein
MSEVQMNGQRARSSTPANVVDELCDRFEAEWRAGQRPQIEDIVAAAPDLLAHGLLKELLAAELELQLRAGERPEPGEYDERFPGHDALVTAAFDSLTAPEAEVSWETSNGFGVEGSLDTVSRNGGTAAPEMATGTRLGVYEINDVLGRGGMGTVYRAMHSLLKRDLALKVLPSERLRDPAAVVRFRHEMEAIGRLCHPNVVEARDAGQAGGVHFLVMELVDGIDLHRLVRERGPLSVADACEIARQAAEGLAHAHQNGLVHRDVKPRNIMVNPDGRVKLLDLGLARFLDRRGDDAGAGESGELIGTLDYMAPEQVLGIRNVDIRADLYSLGCTLYFLLAGHPPASGSSTRSGLDALLSQARGQPPEPIRRLRPDVPESLAMVLERLLARRPSERYASPGEVVAALEPFTAGRRLPRLLQPAEAADNVVMSYGALALPRHDPKAAGTLISPTKPPNLESCQTLTANGNGRWAGRPSIKWAIAVGVVSLNVCFTTAKILWKPYEIVAHLHRFDPWVVAAATTQEVDRCLNHGRKHMDRKEYALAIADFSRAIELDPKNGTTYMERGEALQNSKQVDKAIEDFTTAIQFGVVAAYSCRGNCWRLKENLKRALEDYNASVKTLPGPWAPRYIERGKILGALAEDEKAIADYEQATGIDRKNVEAHSLLAQSLLRCPDPKDRKFRRAIEAAAWANTLTDSKDVVILKFLAAAHAAVGELDAAIDWQTKAIKHVPPADAETLARYTATLHVYKAGQREQSGKQTD